jgi:hypothetical protein
LYELATETKLARETVAGVVSNFGASNSIDVAFEVNLTHTITSDLRPTTDI